MFRNYSSFIQNILVVSKVWKNYNFKGGKFFFFNHLNKNSITHTVIFSK